MGGADFRPPRVWKLTIPFGRSRDDDDRDEPGLAAPCRHTHGHSDTCIRHDLLITLRTFQLNCIQYYLNEESARKNANTPRCVQKGGAQNFHLQLIKFWWSCAPVKRVCGGAKIFGSALQRPARSDCVSPSAFFICFLPSVSRIQRGLEKN